LAFGGQNPSMILSKYPFAKKSDGTDDVDRFVLPSTNFRRTVLYAKIQIDPAHTVDLYCPQFTSPLLGQNLPYNGSYAQASTIGEDAGASYQFDLYSDENLLQAHKTVDWIRSKTGSGQAI